MGRQSQAWKNLERDVAKALNGHRVLRGADFSIEDVDVVVPDFPELKIDAKYRTRHAHHSLLEEIAGKYCQHNGDVPVLVTKHHHQVSANVTVPLAYFAELLALARLWKGRNREPQDLRGAERQTPRLHVLATTGLVLEDPPA